VGAGLSQLITIVATLTAIASAIIAVMAIRAQREAAKLQSRASVVSASRQRWIDALRDDIAEFLTVDAEHKAFDASPSFDPDVNLASIREKDRLLARQMLLLRRVRLRLNPAEDIHNDLLDRMKRLVVAPQLESAAASEEVVELAQTILKAEWERVKREASGDVHMASPPFTP
jgi:hypothetical protein